MLNANPPSQSMAMGSTTGSDRASGPVVYCDRMEATTDRDRVSYHEGMD